MDLVWKKNPRGRLERKLNLAERGIAACFQQQSKTRSG